MASDQNEPDRVSAMPPSDEDLFASWAADCHGGQGDGPFKSSAGEKRFQRHFEAVARFFQNKATFKDTEDLVQKTFLEFVRSRDRFRHQATIRTFLFGIARNVLFQHIRASGHEGLLDFTVQSLHDLDPNPSQAVFMKEERRLLMQALRRIPLDLQITIELYYWEALSASDIAVITDVPEGTVRSRLRRGLEELRRQIEALPATTAALRSASLSDLDRWAEQVRGRI